MSASTRLSVELEAQLLHRLTLEWRGLNYSQFRSSLRPPVIRLADASSTDNSSPLAHWNPELRSLELSRRLVLEWPWAEVLETLKRMMVQQFVDERLSVNEHRRGPSYRRICRRLGVDPVPPREPKPRPDKPGADSSDNSNDKSSARIIRRVHKLLALATSPNRHEAETAAMTAQRLLLKFNIAHVQLEDPDPIQAYQFRHFGPALAGLREHDQRLAKILNEYFFVETAWLPIYLPERGARATVLEACGLDLNLAMAEHVHAFLRSTSARLWSEYRGSAAQPSARARLAFLAGVMQGFEAKLAEQQRRLEQQGLVWLPAPELDLFFARRNPGLRAVLGEAGHHGDAYECGAQAGRAITLSPPVRASSTTAGVPRALGSPSPRQSR